ncbi:MAG: YfhO family protein [Flavobacteriaceae bacterium]|nr:YfhO family protein [Flavobacteriaceae bacterium]
MKITNYKDIFRSFIPYLCAGTLFVIASLLYFNPVLSGKQIKQSDITQFSGMAKEVVDYRNTHNGEEPYWLGNAFSGMPAYQVSTYYPNDFMRYVDNAFRFLPRPADYLFLYFIGFFLLLMALKTDWKLAILGALSFGFSTYLIIIFGAGHNAKAHAIAYMPMVIAGFLYVFRKRYLIGFVITALAMALEIYANHLQMTYYLGFILFILGIVELIYAVKNKELKPLFKQVSVLLMAIFIGIGMNATRLMATAEYANYSNRGKSELTFNPDGSPKQVTSGLDKDYITEYSYGKLETFNLLIPRFMGGGTVEKLDESSNFYKVLAQNTDPRTAKEYASQVLTYWGTQPIVEAPAYIGAIVFFLFFLGIFLVRGKLKWWLVSATIFSILLSWGKNFGFLTDFFIDYVPLYNKFRAVSSIQVIAELCVPLLGILGLKEFFSAEISNENKQKALKNAVISFVGLVVLGFGMAYMSSTFEGIRDGQYQQLPALIDALISDRKSMLFLDSFRSVVLVILSAGTLFFFLKNKLKKVPLLLILGALILFDLVSVDMRYVNKDDFTSPRKVQVPFVATQMDKDIMADKSHYRVANFTTNFMNEARTAYFHNSIGGYHAAKMKRYQELFDYQFGGKNQNSQILNMLNVKYIIVGANQVQLNTEANGNAWFVDEVVVADSADDEMKTLSEIDTKKIAVIREPNFSKNEPLPQIVQDSLATIELKKYEPNHLVYETNAKGFQFAVFSEIYYKNGWNAYIDGKQTPHYQTDYVLRGMEIPAGKHKIEFKFQPTVIEVGKNISLGAYVLLVVVSLVWFLFHRKRNC